MFPTPLSDPDGTLDCMALRFTVQGDDEAETAAGLRMLLTLGLVKWMEPKLLTDNRWMARAVPKPEPREQPEA